MSIALKWTATASITCLTVLLLVHPTQAAVMYRWSDGNGRPVISDRPPPPGTPYTTLDSSQYGKSNLRTEGATSKNSEAGTAKASNQQSNSSSDTTASVRIQKNADLCKHAQDNIYTYENFERIRTVDPDGTVRFMSSAEIESKLIETREVESRHC